ncbi:hypothetical protein T484DRAFT_1756353 [Baffinella frigidus]|nr:hypothetical protein T484DRAFT_1756353 [Cryptophyta sp. CCMP2293]
MENRRNPAVNKGGLTFAEFFGVETTFDLIYGLNFLTAGVHAISALIILVMFMSSEPSPSLDEVGGITVYLPSVCYTPDRNNEGRPTFTLEPQPVVSVKTYFAVIVILFFVLSAGFQFAAGIRKNGYRKRLVRNDVNIWRYAEYSLSASLMMVAIACVLTVYDFFTHMLVFLCTFLCMHLGLVADFLRYLQGTLHFGISQDLGLGTEAYETAVNCVTSVKHLKWFVHVLSWAAIFVPYFCVFFVGYGFTAFALWDCLADLPDDARDMPFYVHMIVILQFLLFNIFGVVQLMQFLSNTGETTPKTESALYRWFGYGVVETVQKVGIRTEHRFILLSLIAKSLLGWLIAANLIFT